MPHIVYPDIGILLNSRRNSDLTLIRRKRKMTDFRLGLTDRILHIPATIYKYQLHIRWPLK
jgi:hypothetical protein